MAAWGLNPDFSDSQNLFVPKLGTGSPLLSQHLQTPEIDIIDMSSCKLTFLREVSSLTSQSSPVSVKDKPFLPFGQKSWHQPPPFPRTHTQSVSSPSSGQTPATSLPQPPSQPLLDSPVASLLISLASSLVSLFSVREPEGSDHITALLRTLSSF